MKAYLSVFEFRAQALAWARNYTLLEIDHFDVILSLVLLSITLGIKDYRTENTIYDVVEVGKILRVGFCTSC